MHAIWKDDLHIGSVLQCAAVCCSVLQCVAVSCSVLQCVAVCCSVLQLTPGIYIPHFILGNDIYTGYVWAVSCSVLHYVAVFATLYVKTTYI